MKATPGVVSVSSMPSPDKDVKPLLKEEGVCMPCTIRYTTGKSDGDSKAVIKHDGSSLLHDISVQQLTQPTSHSAHHSHIGCLGY